MLDAQEIRLIDLEDEDAGVYHAVNQPEAKVPARAWTGKRKEVLSAAAVPARAVVYQTPEGKTRKTVVVVAAVAVGWRQQKEWNLDSWSTGP